MTIMGTLRKPFAICDSINFVIEFGKFLIISNIKVQVKVQLKEIKKEPHHKLMKKYLL